jgi:short-subunit dehydrogenase
MQRILIIGATSAIAEATARLFAERGDGLYLLARDGEHLRTIAADLATRGAARVETATLNVGDFNAHAAAIDTTWRELESIDVALIAHGSGAYDHGHLQSLEALRQSFDTNATATIALMARIGMRMAQQGHGTLAVIASVAGDRGRAFNLLYGSAKAAVSTYASGLRQHLLRSNVHVLTIKPGQVDTPMTAGLRKTALFAEPETIARGIVRAIDRRRNVVYLPWFWRPLMSAVRSIPEPLWKRMKF